MLCEQCLTIKFTTSASNHRGMTYILHKTRSSFDESLARGCSLCLLIRGKLDKHESRSDVCDELAAYVVLVQYWKLSKNGTLQKTRSISVASRLGSAVFDVIEPIPGLLTHPTSSLHT